MLRRLREAGKRHSAADQQMLQQVHDHAVALGADCAAVEAERAPAPGFHLAESIDELSHNDLAELLRTALKADHPGPDTYVYVRDVYDDAVVYGVEGPGGSQLYRRAYAVLDGAVTFAGEPVAVIAVTQYEPVGASEAAESGASEITGELVPLSEKAVAQDGTIRLKIIAPGQGSSGYYPADVLKRDGPKVFTAGTHMHLDHPSASEEADRPERSVTTLAGTLTSDARWDEQGPAGPGLYAEAKVRSDLAPLIEELAPHIGVSIRALGKAGTRDIGGKKVRTIEAVEQAKSVDFVTVPGRDGRILQLIEAARGRRAAAPGGDDDVSQEELAEARRKIAELEAWKAQQERREAEARLLGEARTVVTETLAGIQLPAPTRARLAESLAANPPATSDGALDRAALVAAVTEAADAEVAYLASVAGGNPVRGMGGAPAAATTPTLEESDKRIAAALAAI